LAPISLPIFFIHALSLAPRSFPKKLTQIVSWYLKPTCKPGQLMTDMYYPCHPQGLYEAVMQAKEYGVPIYITETGCADRGDAIRPVVIDSYFRAALRAMKDGADLRGFYYWVSCWREADAWKKRGEAGVLGAGGGQDLGPDAPRSPLENQKKNDFFFWF
jgi:hypothetical protein